MRAAERSPVHTEGPECTAMSPELKSCKADSWQWQGTQMLCDWDSGCLHQVAPSCSEPLGGAPNKRARTGWREKHRTLTSLYTEYQPRVEACRKESLGIEACTVMASELYDALASAPIVDRRLNTAGERSRILTRALAVRDILRLQDPTVAMVQDVQYASASPAEDGKQGAKAVRLQRSSNEAEAEASPDQCLMSVCLLLAALFEQTPFTADLKKRLYHDFTQLKRHFRKDELLVLHGNTSSVGELFASVKAIDKRSGLQNLIGVMFEDWKVHHRVDPFIMADQLDVEVLALTCEGPIGKFPCKLRTLVTLDTLHQRLQRELYRARFANRTPPKAQLEVMTDSDPLDYIDFTESMARNMPFRHGAPGSHQYYAWMYAPEVNATPEVWEQILGPGHNACPSLFDGVTLPADLIHSSTIEGHDYVLDVSKAAGHNFAAEPAQGALAFPWADDLLGAWLRKVKQKQQQQQQSAAAKLADTAHDTDSLEQQQQQQSMSTSSASTSPTCTASMAAGTASPCSPLDLGATSRPTPHIKQQPVGDAAHPPVWHQGAVLLPTVKSEPGSSPALCQSSLADQSTAQAHTTALPKQEGRGPVLGPCKQQQPDVKPGSQEVAGQHAAAVWPAHMDCCAAAGPQPSLPGSTTLCKAEPDHHMAAAGPCPGKPPHPLKGATPSHLTLHPSPGGWAPQAGPIDCHAARTPCQGEAAVCQVAAGQCGSDIAAQAGSTGWAGHDLPHISDHPSKCKAAAAAAGAVSPPLSPHPRQPAAPCATPTLPHSTSKASAPSVTPIPNAEKSGKLALPLGIFLVGLICSGGYANTQIHVEDLLLMSININIFGAPKVWWWVPQECVQEFKECSEQLTEGGRGELYTKSISPFLTDPDEQPAAHIMPLEKLRELGVKRAIQVPGMGMWTMPGYAFHFTVSMGFNVAESCNCFLDVMGWTFEKLWLARPLEQYPEAEDDMARFMSETGVLATLGVPDRLPRNAAEVHRQLAPRILPGTASSKDGRGRLTRLVAQDVVKYAAMCVEAPDTTPAALT
ncbi:hypothetical protein QJQ45_029516 [Haematococcus lacustris]|nr:hypothetical protein QJQ45_029516 [Haematococcus lacustris]